MLHTLFESPYKRIFRFLFLGAILAVIVTAGSAEKKTTNPQATLFDRAKAAGGHLVEGFEADRSVTAANAAELVKHSDVIVVGRAMRIRSYLDKGLRSIHSDVAIHVQGVLKGDVRNGSVINVSISGGAHRYADSTIAALYPSNSRFARMEHTYMYFLSAPKYRGQSYQLSMGIQSQFELDSGSGKILPSDAVVMDPVVKKYTHMPIGKFLTQVRSTLGKHKKS